MENLEENFKLIKEEIYEQMLRTRGLKYRWFLRALKSFKYLPLNPKRGEFLESYYILMRYIDDVVDGDAPLPRGYQNSESFVLDKIRFSEKPLRPQDKLDYLILHCFDLANNFGEDPKKHTLLEPLGFASRTYYNLRDYEEDIQAGLVNIPTEDYERFGITQKDLESRLSPPIQAWMQGQAKKGIGLIKEHRQNMGECEFGILARITLPIVYESPAKRYFEMILQKQ